MKRLLQMIFLVASLPLSAEAAVVEWKVADGGNGHAYELVTDQLAWPDARTAATLRNGPPGFGTGHLATISNIAENQFLVDNFAVLTPFGFYMGFTDELVEGEWHWVDATPGIWQDPDNFLNPIQTAYTNWAPSEPNDLGGEDYGILRGGTATDWNDGQITPPGPYVVEWSPVPEPSALLLAGVGLWGVYVARRFGRQI